MKMKSLIKVLDSGMEGNLLDSYSFDGTRKFAFKIKLTDRLYLIEWWCNISYLTTECGTCIPFDNVEISGTWPNRFRNNLQFSYFDNVCGIIPIEKHQSGKS